MYLHFTAQKLKNIFADSAVAILPVSVRLIEKPVNRKFSVNRLTVNISSDYIVEVSVSSVVGM